MSDVIDRFAAMSAAELGEFFRTSDVLEITEVIRVGRATRSCAR